MCPALLSRHNTLSGHARARHYDVSVCRRGLGMAETEHRLLITGAGRAGTSFLVKYLAELGLDTHLEGPDGASRRSGARRPRDLLLLEQPKHLPYVIKSPWLTEYIDQVLARDDIAIDGVVIPVRESCRSCDQQSGR